MNIVGKRVRVKKTTNSSKPVGTEDMVYPTEIVTVLSNLNSFLTVEKDNGVQDSGSAKLFQYLNNKEIKL